MDVKRVGYAIVFVILVCALATASSEGRKRTIGRAVASSYPLRDQDMAEQLWVNCRPDLAHIKEAVENFELYFPEETAIGSNEINSKIRAATKVDLEKAIGVLPPPMKQLLLDCLKKQNILFRVSAEESSYKNWYFKYLEFLFGRTDASRRYLTGELVQHMAVNPASAPPVKPPTYGRDPSSNTPPASSPAPYPHTSALPPEKLSFSPNLTNSKTKLSTAVHSSSTPKKSNTKKKLPKKSTKKKKKKNTSKHTPHVPSKHTSSSMPVFVAVLVIAVGTLVLVVLLFCCCYKCCRNNVDTKDGEKDERPLLSLSDLSTCSSINKRTYGSDTLSLEAAVGPARSSVEPSAAATNSNAPQLPLPPLKPPPGRAVPSLPGPPPPIPSGIKPPAPRPPPPPKGVSAPRPPPPMSSKVTKPSSLVPDPPQNPASVTDDDVDAQKTKLKPFFWDKVLAKPDESMVWHQISSGSFQFNEEMIETLFGCANMDKRKNDRKKDSSSQDPSTQYIQIIDSKKSQNLAILLRALNVTTAEVCDALKEGNELPTEFLQTLLKMAPTAEEELKLRVFTGELSQLGLAERFLKVLVEIPFAFKRMDTLLFMCSLQEEVSSVKESLATLEVACKELKSSRLFFKLLEAVLKTGNRMNVGTYRGGAQAFRLDTLLKLSDVKGTDGKTTLLHFVVQEIIRSEGVRAARVIRESQSFSSVKSEDLMEDSQHETQDHYRSLGLEVVSGLDGELENVRKAAAVDADALTGTVSKLGHALVRTKEFLNSEMASLDEDSGFHQALKSFIGDAETDIMWLLEEEKRIMVLIKTTADYFHGNAGKDEGLRLFLIVRDFLIILNKACKEVRESVKKSMSAPRNKEAPTSQSSMDPRQPPSPDLRQRFFPAIMDRRMDNSSSDDEDSSP